jgi:hypothetical protein
VFASVLFLAALAALMAAGASLIAAGRLRRRVKAAAWCYTRVATAIAEAERAWRVDVDRS